MSEHLRRDLSKGYKSCFSSNKFKKGNRELDDDLCDTSNHIITFDVVVFRLAIQ